MDLSFLFSTDARRWFTMPLTFIDIERQKNWRIPVFFLALMVLYVCLTALFAVVFMPAALLAATRFWVFIGVMALVIAVIHFWFSAYDTVGVVIRTLGGVDPDRRDDIHRVLINIMDEVHVVTGNQRKIRCFVVPSLSLNALAVADLKGEAAIGITEGLLSRLSRPQLETVVAHEIHHILSGDCLETTVAASLFGTYASIIENLRDLSRGRTFFMSPAFVLAWILLHLSNLLNMFISREREYRADAAAVRMARNPLALAETLHLLSRSWRGAGFIGTGFEMICIVNPQATAVDEQEGFWADLVSTHPPIARRIKLLLSMARVSVAELDEKAAAREVKSAEPGTVPRYYALNPQQLWQGPFAIDELGMLPWLSPLTWVTSGDDRQDVERAWKQPLFAPIFAKRLTGKEKEVSRHACPVCKQPLRRSSYEGADILECSFCAGILVENGKIARIIARTGRERPCSERITALARTTADGNGKRQLARFHSAKTRIPLYVCPQCGNAMYRGFYSAAHLIEIDRCSFCNLTWFDPDELAMLQCLIKNKIAPDGQQMQTLS